MTPETRTGPKTPAPPAPGDGFAQAVRVRWDRQLDAWLRGERLPVEALLEDHPALRTDERCVALIFNEIDLREALGETPCWEEYQDRFPHFERQLQRRFSRQEDPPPERSAPVPAEAPADVAPPTLAPDAPPTDVIPPTLAPNAFPPTLAPEYPFSPAVAPRGMVHPIAVPLVPGGDFDGATHAYDGQGLEADKDRAVPATVAGYEILGELGRGGMGVVYKARQLALNRVVALKMILAGAHAGSQELNRFRIEAEAVAQLKHPNIVQVYDIGECEGKPFFSLEFVEGGSLERKLNRKSQKGREAAELVETLARAMHSAHQKGVIHRDLKPANILLTPEGMPKITDFGLAKRLEDESGQTQSGSIMGTPSYMAPEQAAGRIEDMGPATDVYALGAILYDALTGRPPFKGATVLDTLAQVRNDEPVPPSRLQPRVPRDLETICLKCLQKSPRKRYASGLALAEDLRRYLNGEPILARPRGRVERLWRWCLRNPVAASLLLTVTLGSIFGMWYLSQLSESLVRSTAIEGAAQQSETFDRLNDFYTTDVVDRAKPGGFPVLGASTLGLLGSPDGQGPMLSAGALFPGRNERPGVAATSAYKKTLGTIPAPATLTIDFGDYVTANSDRGTVVRLYSDLPFRNRTDGGVRDAFEREALERLREHPDTPFYRFEETGGGMVLRYATARVMKQSCVDCHNSHPDSPRHGWQVGDVRGVLEITRSLEQDEKRTRQGLQGATGLVAGVSVSLLALCTLIVVVGNWRRRQARSPSP